MKLPTDKQTAAIYSEADILAIIATPGSGKTYTLLERVKRMLADGADPQSVFIVTFTNAAANEFRERLEASGTETRSLGYCGTIHGLALRTIAEYSERPLSIISRELGDSIMEGIIETMGVKVTKAQILAQLPCKRARTNVEICARAYTNELARLGAIELDTLIETADGILDHADNKPAVNLFIDEYQDTSATDAAFLWNLVEVGPGVMVQCSTITAVGDPWQAIYRFRGARPENLDDFVERAQETVFLDTSFRLGPKVAGIAGRISDRMIVAGGMDDHAYTVPHKTAEEELFWLRAMIHELLGDEYSFNPRDIAVLCRYNRGVDAARAMVMSGGIPCNQPSEPTLEAGMAKAVAFAQLVSDPSPLAKAEYALRFKTVSDPITTDAMKLDTNALYAGMVRSGIAARQASSFCSIRKQSDSLVDTVTRIRIDGIEGNRDNADGNSVTIATMHGSKGREWPVVIVLGCEEMTIPGHNADADRVAEERRLFYVAITRASAGLVLSHSETRTGFHEREPQMTAPSRFLQEGGLI